MRGLCSWAFGLRCISMSKDFKITMLILLPISFGVIIFYQYVFHPMKVHKTLYKIIDTIHPDCSTFNKESCVNKSYCAWQNCTVRDHAGPDGTVSVCRNKKSAHSNSEKGGSYDKISFVGNWKCQSE